MKRKDGIGYTAKGLAMVFFMYLYVAVMFFWGPYEEIGFMLALPVCLVSTLIYSLIAGNSLSDSKYIILGLGIIPPLIVYVASYNAPESLGLWSLRFISGAFAFVVFKLVSKILYTED